MARPTKLTPAVHKEIVDAIAIGATYKNAVGAAGISYVTFLDWLERGRKIQDGETRKSKSNTKYLEFLKSVEKAKHTAFLRYTSTIAKAANSGDWRAAESFLKRRDPENWGDKKDITSGGERITWAQFVNGDDNS